jgi:hypothetical protein
MSQYDMTIVYIHGEDNTVADALSCVSPNAFPDEQLQVSLLNSSGSQLPPMVPIGAVLLIATDHLVLDAIRAGDLRENLYRLAHDNLGHFGVGLSTSLDLWVSHAYISLFVT